jgi:hypothetical protein
VLSLQNLNLELPKQVCAECNVEKWIGEFETYKSSSYVTKKCRTCLNKRKNSGKMADEKRALRKNSLAATGTFYAWR